MSNPRSWCLLLCALSVASCSPPYDVYEDVDQAESELMRRLRRVAHARAFQQEEWTVPGRDPEYVGAQLAKLQPTWVSGLVRMSTPTMNPADYQGRVDAWNRIRAVVRQANPGAKFDLVLNMLPAHYPTPEKLRNSMAFLDGLFQPDGWYFDFLDNGDPNVIAAAVRYAHSHDQFIGGNLNGGGGRVPKGMDFVGITDGTDIRKHLLNLRTNYGGPILLHIENNPHHNNPDNGALLFLEGGAEHRRRYVRELAELSGQRPRFTLMYPVFFPLYPLEGNGPRSYDAAEDGTLPSIKRLMGLGN